MASIKKFRLSTLSKALVLVALTSPAFAQEATELLLDVQLNTMNRGIVQFGEVGGVLTATAKSLRSLGFLLPDQKDDAAVDMQSLTGLKIDYSPLQQKLSFSAPLELLDLPISSLGTAKSDLVSASSSPGLLLNYDLFGSLDGNKTTSLNAFTELRAFAGQDLVLSTTNLTQSVNSGMDGWTTQSVRLDTTLSKSWQDKMITLRVGDTLTAGLPWARQVRIGGIQLAKNFALQPDRQTAPLPLFLGSAALPSTVELFVDGIQRFSGKVPVGPFELNNAPVMGGQGIAKLVTTDVLGRATVVEYSLYETRGLLEKGLSDWSVDAGFVRKNFGLASSGYGGFAATGTYRLGVSKSFTTETRVEAKRGLVVAGLGGVWSGAEGLISGAVSHSKNEAGGGSQINMGYAWRRDSFSWGMNGTRTFGTYRDVAGTPSAASGRAFAGWSAGVAGNLGLSYVYLKRSEAGMEVSRYLSASWSKSMGNGISLVANLTQNLAVRAEKTLFFGLNWALDGQQRTNINSSAQRDKSNTAFSLIAQKPVSSEGGLSWAAGARKSAGQAGAQTEVGYLGNYGRVAAGLNVLGDNKYAYASASGSLVTMGGEILAGRRIDDSFAVVSTSGIEGVSVMLENKKVGVTGPGGKLLITPLGSYQANKIGIDSLQLAADMRVGKSKQIVMPSDRAGALVSFDLQRVHSASVLLVDASDKPITLGSVVTVNDQAEQLIVGFDGAVYIDSLASGSNTLNVSGDGSCTVKFDYQKTGDSIPEIGPLRCTKGGL